MSQENVEMMRAVFAAWNSDMEAHNAMYHPDAVIWAPAGWPEGRVFFGMEAVTRQFSQMREAFDADALEIVDMVSVGNRVAVRLVWHGAGRGPSADLELSGIYTVRGGQVLAVEFFWDHTEALEALGLSEQGAHADS